jgi:hypothetical protein
MHKKDTEDAYISFSQRPDEFERRYETRESFTDEAKRAAEIREKAGKAASTDDAKLQKEKTADTPKGAKRGRGREDGKERDSPSSGKKVRKDDDHLTEKERIRLVKRALQSTRPPPWVKGNKYTPDPTKRYSGRKAECLQMR